MKNGHKPPAGPDPTGATWPGWCFDHPPSPAELLDNVELPFAARYVENPPEPTARRIASPPLIALLDRAQELLDATAIDVADVRALVVPARRSGLQPRSPQAAQSQ
jgi:hypothetical protein